MSLGKHFDRADAPWPYEPAHVRVIARAALRGFWKIRQEDDQFDDGGDQDARASAALQGLRFAARAMAYAPEPDHLKVHLRVLGAIEVIDPPAYGHSSFLAQCTSRVLAAADEPGPAVERLAREGGLEARLGLARSLRLDRPAHLALLRSMARDVAKKVRSTAQARLGKVEAVPWWAGHLSRDPRPFFGKAKAKQSGGEKALKKLFESLDGTLDGDSRAGFESALGALPGAVATDLLGVALAFPRNDEHHAIVLNALCSLAGTEVDDLLVERAERWAARPMVILTVGGMFRSYGALLGEGGERKKGRKTSALAAPEGERVRRCVALARRLVAMEPREPRPLESDPRAVLFEFIEGMWPEKADTSGLLDALLEAAPARGARGRALAPATGASARPLAKLGALVGNGFGEGMPEALRTRVDEALLRGLPGAWKYLAAGCRSLVEKGAPTKARSLALALLANAETDEESRAWALGVLATTGYDAAKDPPRDSLARAWLADPACRRALFSDRECLARVMPVAREELAAGRCTWDEAVAIAQEAVELWTGWEPDPRETDWDRLRDSLPPRMEAMHGLMEETCTRRAPLGPWLAVGDRVGSLRDDELAVLRAMRSAEEAKPGAADGVEDAKAWVQRVFRERALLPDRSTRWTPQERARFGAMVEDTVSRFERGVEANVFFVCLVLRRLLRNACDDACLPYFERFGDVPKQEYFDPVEPNMSEAYEAFCARMGTDPDPEFFEKAKARAKRAKGASATPAEKPKSKSDDGWGDDDE